MSTQGTSLGGGPWLWVPWPAHRCCYASCNDTQCCVMLLLANYGLPFIVVQWERATMANKVMPLMVGFPPCCMHTGPQYCTIVVCGRGATISLAAKTKREHLKSDWHVQRLKAKKSMRPLNFPQSKLDSSADNNNHSNSSSNNNGNNNNSSNSSGSNQQHPQQPSSVVSLPVAQPMVKANPFQANLS